MEKYNSVRVRITGRVQGVFFRMETKKFADRLGVTGWVRNMADGRVEAVFQGDEDQITEMMAWCKNGPPLSRVENVAVSQENVTEKFTSFEITY